MRFFIKKICVNAWAFFALALSSALVFTLSLPLSRPLVSLGAESGIINGVINAQETDGQKKSLRREYTLYSASSSARFSSGEKLADALYTRGETVIFKTENKAEGEAAARRIISFYGAEVKITESVSGGVSYYCYSKKIGSAQCKTIGKEEINLHVFVSESEVRAGVPLIFGGY